ncbi:AtzH-like domain-containing protein [Demequina litorisediminis]|uniref:AtzH-like domain-containing protein n=1 Tax=Demequina litorisediminis TaxID=1849022 RepID=UPI0024E1072D|nr:AtzH-like domain-containing protein [Demequina litorisediminis]
MTRVHVPEGQEAPEDLLSALSLYEAALAQDDLDVLSRFFVEGPDALRADAGGLLVGRDQIDRFRGRRGGAGRREVTDAHVRMITDADAWVTTVNAPDRGGRGMVTQAVAPHRCGGGRRRYAWWVGDSRGTGRGTRDRLRRSRLARAWQSPRPRRALGCARGPHRGGEGCLRGGGTGDRWWRSRLPRRG